MRQKEVKLVVLFYTTEALVAVTVATTITCEPRRNDFESKCDKKLAHHSSNDRLPPNTKAPLVDNILVLRE